MVGESELDSSSTPQRPEILEYCETPIGLLCLRRRPLLSSPGTIITEVTLDHEFLMSSYYTDSEYALASLAIEWHGGSELDVLIGGLGLGYTAKAALDIEETERVEVVELLPEVISWLPRDLVPLAASLQADPRFRAVVGDIYARLAAAPEKTHDVILIDVDHSPDENLHPANREFYTPNGLVSAREHLSDDGVLAIWSSANDDAFARALEKVFSDIKREEILWRNELIEQDQCDVLFLARH